MENELKEKIEKLSQTAQSGGEVRSWLKHPGYKIFKARIERTSQRDHSRWLHEQDAEKAEEVRQEARWFFHFEDFAKKIIMEGDVARNSVVKLNEENENG